MDRRSDRVMGAGPLAMVLLMAVTSVRADLGAYTARVTVLSGVPEALDPRAAVPRGSYSLPVVIENDEVTAILWSDGRRIPVTTGQLYGLRASVMSERGQRIFVEVTDDRFHREDTANDETPDSTPDDNN